MFRSTIQAVSYGTRHIIDTMNAAGHQLTAIVATGGMSKSSLFLQELADATALPVFLPKEQDSCLLGGAILAAKGSRLIVNEEHRAYLPQASRRSFRKCFKNQARCN
jgi:ribulose kinase